MVGVNIGDMFTPTPWPPEKIEQALSEARCSGYFSCDAVKFWHCDASRILPTARQDQIRKVCGGLEISEFLRLDVSSSLWPIIGGKESTASTESRGFKDAVSMAVVLSLFVHPISRAPAAATAAAVPPVPLRHTIRNQQRRPPVPGLTAVGWESSRVHL